MSARSATGLRIGQVRRSSRPYGGAARREDSVRVGLAVALIFIVIGCGPAREDALTGRTYLAVVPQAEVVGTWSWRSAPSDLLQLRPDHSCSITPSMAEHLDNCGDTHSSPSAVHEPCVWAVERKPEGEGVVVMFQAPRRGTRSVGFGVFRHAVRPQVALLGMCGSGDAYALQKAGEPLTH